MADFEAFMQKLSQRVDLPSEDYPMARIKILAKELAEGAAYRIWSSEFGVSEGPSQEKMDEWVLEILDPNIKAYLDRRWGNQYPDVRLLKNNGYIDNPIMLHHYNITEKAFSLVQKAEPFSIFISYRRKTSSAFALLLLARLKEHGLDVFLDMLIPAGDDWHSHIEEKIRDRRYFILLLGKTTLEIEEQEKDVLLKEISWAIKYETKIIPVWHNQFKYKAGKYNIPASIDEILEKPQAIQVKEESASGYNTAIVELLNRFGITP